MYEVLNLRYVLYVCTVLYIVRLVDVYSIHRKLFAIFKQSSGVCASMVDCVIIRGEVRRNACTWEKYMVFILCVNMC